MITVSIIIPTLNEAGNIDILIRDIFSVTRRYQFIAEVIVVDDGSLDGTREKVTGLSKRFPVTLICRDHQGGLASAVVAGAKGAQYDLVLVMDGDLSHSPEYIPCSSGPCSMDLPTLQLAVGMFLADRHPIGL